MPCSTALLEARDALLLPPFDPIDDVLYTLDQGLSPEVDVALHQARAQLDHSDRALAATQQALAQLRAEIAQQQPPAARRAPDPPSPPDPDDDTVRQLKGRLQHLKAQLKERHRERNALRRELGAARRRMAEIATDDAQPPANDDDPAPDSAPDPPTRRVRLPTFPADFRDRLAEVPDATARSTLARIGGLCAGEAHATAECPPDPRCAGHLAHQDRPQLSAAVPPGRRRPRRHRPGPPTGSREAPGAPQGHI